MKKLIALLLAALTVLSLAACGAIDRKDEGSKPTESQPAPSEPAGTEEVPVAAANGATDVLNAIWTAMPEDKKFPAMGGDFNAAVNGAAGVAEITNADYLTYNLLVPAEQAAALAEAGSLVHMMNGNNFTAAAYVLAEGQDAKAFGEAMKTAISGNQWVCGFPEKLLVADVDGTVVVVFGLAEFLEEFKTQLTGVYADAEILTYEDILG